MAVDRAVPKLIPTLVVKPCKALAIPSFSLGVADIIELALGDWNKPILIPIIVEVTT